VGGVPVRTLGLPDSYAGDAWGNKFTYTTGDFLVNDASSYSRRVGQLVVKYGNIATGYSVNTQRLATAPTYSAVTDLGGGVARITVNDTSNLAAGSIVHLSSNTPATGYKGSYTVVVPPVVGAEAIVANTSFTVSGLAFTATDAGKVEWLAAGDDVAYTVVSHGPDGRGAFPLNGTAVPTFKQCNNSAVANSSPPPCTDNTAPNLVCVDIENCDNDSTFYDTAYNDGNIAAQYFDDYIVWGSNALMRPPVNNSLYTSCAGNPCEPWCATCDLNYPGGGAVAPPATLTAPVALCKKVGTSNATDCKAACFWAGTTATGYQKCP
jgi:hypothetical protein